MRQVASPPAKHTVIRGCTTIASFSMLQLLHVSAALWQAFKHNEA